MVKDANGKVIFSLDPDVIEQIFRIPPSTECADLSKDKSIQLWNQNKLDYQRYMNDQWLVNKRSSFSKWPKTIHKSDFSPKANDLITLLSRICGLKESCNFEPWMYKFIFQILENKEPIYWGEFISTALCEQLSHVGTSVPFYMNSYLVYIATAMGTFSGLSTRGDQSLVPIWEYHDQITFTQSKYHYRRVQDASFGHFRCLLIKS